MSQSSPFVPLLLITLLAVVVPVLVSRKRLVRLPIVVGEILAGIIIGQSGFDLVRPSPTLLFLSGFGFTFLMFLSGLEVSFDTLFAAAEAEDQGPWWRRPLFLAVTSFLGTMVLALLVALGLSALELARNPLLLGLILSTTSLGIVVPVLKERGLMTTTYGQVLLLTAVLSDFVTLLLLSLVAAVLTRKWDLDLLLVLFLLVAFVVAVKLSQWASRLPMLPRIVEELTHATAQIQVRGVFALMIAWVVLAQALGVEVILGAFLAGALVSLSGHGRETRLREQLDAIGYGFFIPLFFIMVGANLDLRTVLGSRRAMLLVPLLIVAAYLIKVMPVLCYRLRFSWRETLAAGILLSSRLSLIIAASAIALELGMITAATHTAIVLVAVVTCTCSPMIFSRMLPAEEEKQRQGVIILGTDQLAELLAGRLHQDGESVTFINPDGQPVEHLSQAGFRAIRGDPLDTQVLERAGASQAQALIVTSNASETVLGACRIAQEHFQIPTIIARADDPLLVRQLQHLHVQVVQPALATALALEAALRFPATFKMLIDKADTMDVVDIPLHNAALAGRSLRQVHLPGDALVIGLRRQGEIVVPHGDTVLQLEDMLMLVGSPKALREAHLWLQAHSGDAGGSL